MEHDATFPSYAALTQTQGWSGGGPPPVGIAADLEQSYGVRYKETTLLGSGGMGKVMLARDARVGRDVALKILHPQHELEPAERERFLREAQVQGQLEHPSIVPVYDIDRREDGTTFFTMRRVLGRTLAAILEDLERGDPEAKQRYTRRELLQAFATVCLTVDYAHSRNVIHRDLKPANIMLGDFGEVYVLDWGLARLLDPTPAVRDASRLSTPGTMMGTPLYMAPEQMADPDVDAAADVFSLGVILFEILTLERCRDPHALYVPVEARPSQRAPDLDIAPELEKICVTATQMLASDRYPSARAIQEAVARYLEGDRDREQRRTIAARQVERAREELAKSDEGGEHEQDALRHVLRAIALEPANRGHVAILAEIMGTPPRTTPPEIAKLLADGAQDLVRAGSRYTFFSLVAWFLFLPILLALGVRRFDHVAGIAIPIGTVAVMSLFTARRPHNGRVIQCVMMSIMIVGGMMLSRLFGPLVLMPTVFTSWAIVLQAHPESFMRRYGLAISVAGIALPLVLELAGVIPASYVFEHGRFEIVPQLADFPRIPTLVFLGLASVAVTIIPALFVARLRAQLTQSRERELLQDWKLRRLRDDLLRAGARASTDP